MDEELKLWKDFTTEDWLNASYCESCGLPLMQSEPDENGVSETFCVYCTWIEDDKVIGNKRTRELESELASLRAKYRMTSVEDGLPEKDTNEQWEMYLCEIYDGVIAPLAFIGGSWCAHYHSQHIIYDKRVTKWMPLPQPMEEVKE